MVTISRQTGFTLIEVMIVVVIVGILAAIGIPNFLRYRAHAMQAEARSNLGTIYVGEVSFFTERKEFGNFTDIGFAITGGGTNRYTYRTGLGLGAGLGLNGANLDADVTHDGWYVNDAKEGLISAEPNDVTS